MHVYKFLEARGGTIGQQDSALFGAETPQAAAEDQPSPEAQVVRPQAEAERSADGNSLGWHKRPPGWALRWEGSGLTPIEE